MTRNNNNLDKIIFAVMALLIVLTLLTLESCKGVKSASSRIENNTQYENKSDSVVASNNRVEKDSTISLEESSDVATHNRSEVSDTVYKTYIDHQLRQTDSISVHLDSLTGSITFHYYTRTYEREVIHDTLRITNVVIDSSLVSSERTRWKEMYQTVIDSLTKIQATRDSVYNSSENTIMEKETIIKEEAWYCKLKRYANAILLVICIAVIWFFIRKVSKLS